MKKDIQPGKWDTAVGGHVAYGEHLIEAVHREASEIEKEMVNVFAAVGSYELHPDRDEVDEGRWWPVEEIDANLGRGIFTPNFESEFKMIRSSLLALL